MAANPSPSSATLVNPNTNAARKTKQALIIPQCKQILGAWNLKMQLLKDKTAKGNSLPCRHIPLYFHLTFTHHHSQERGQALRECYVNLKFNTKFFVLAGIAQAVRYPSVRDP